MVKKRHHVDLQPPEVGLMVLTKTARFAKNGEWPVVARVEEVNGQEQTATVKWFEKRSKGRWREGRWGQEAIMLDDIIYQNFNLTPLGNKLPQKAQRALEVFEDEHPDYLLVGFILILFSSCNYQSTFFAGSFIAKACGYFKNTITV